MWFLLKGKFYVSLYRTAIRNTEIEVFFTEFWLFEVYPILGYYPRFYPGQLDEALATPQRW
jgi:hypothetical protein